LMQGVVGLSRAGATPGAGERSEAVSLKSRGWILERMHDGRNILLN
jgi:hypothetical protein